MSLVLELDAAVDCGCPPHAQVLHEGWEYEFLMLGLVDNGLRIPYVAENRALATHGLGVLKASCSRPGACPPASAGHSANAFLCWQAYAELPSG